MRWILPAAIVAMIGATALATPLFGLADPVRMDVAGRFAGASAAHWLGQDDIGRDVFSRLLWGARASLAVAVASSCVACVLGTALGVLGGFYAGLVEFLSIRLIDVVLCFPPLLLALLVVTLIGPGIKTLILVLSVLYLPGFGRVAYAGVLSVRARDFVTAQRVLGAGRLRIMRLTILPNIAGPLLVQLSLTAASAVVLESGLSFLGLGVVPPTPSWGLMIGEARDSMDQAPLLLLWPCLALAGTILALNALCDLLAESLDPGRRLPVGFGKLASMPVPRLRPAPSVPEPVLRLEGLTVEIATPSGPIRPVRSVSLTVAPGETLAVVGESGSGKSLTGLALLGLLPSAARVAAGQAWLSGQPMMRLSEPAMRSLRGAAAAMIFQDPMSSLNPVQRIGTQVAEAVQAHHKLSRRELDARVVALLRRVGIADPDRRKLAFPHELSGGMRQRVMIAMAIANSPQLLIADEPTTALDVTIQAQILDLLGQLQRETGMAVIFITHSLPVVAEIAQSVAVMYAGVIVEEGPVAEVFARPRHPYTTALLASAPNEGRAPPRPIPGMVPSPHALPAGCTFAARCVHQLPVCQVTLPALMEVAPGRRSRCLRWEEI